MYLDSAYIAKYYLNEPDAETVRDAIHRARSLVSSEWSVVEVGYAFHRHFRQGALSELQYRELLHAFRKHIEDGPWDLVPLDGRLIRRVSTVMDSLPSHLFLRSGDIVQLISAQEAGEQEIWTSDKHMLAAASHFGLTARSATVY